MKKIYTLMAAIAFGSFAFGQLQVKRLNVADVKISAKHSKSNSKSQAVIWSSDFSNPSDWLISDSLSNGYDWTIDSGGVLPANIALNGPGFDTLHSTSGGNFAIINSDSLGSVVENTDLKTAAPIDLSAYPNVNLVFEQFWAHYSETLTVKISTDGTTWTNFDFTPTSLPGSYSANTQQIILDISSVAGGSATVWISFNYKGNGDF